MVTKMTHEENLIVPFTKALPKHVFEKRVNYMGRKRV